MRATPCSACLALLIWWLPAAAAPRPAGAQTAPETAGRDSGALGEAAVLSVNAVVGGLTAGLWRELAGGSFEEGLAGGMLGGSVAYAGKRVAAGSFPGAGFLGRDLAAAAASIVERSLSSGAPVFRSDRSLLDSDGRRVHGAAAAGVIFLSPMNEDQLRETLGHERVHVLQSDFAHQAWFRPLEASLARRLPRGGWHQRLDYDVLFPGLRWTLGLFGSGPGFDDPFEAEAQLLGSR